MEFTGERFIPKGINNDELSVEHLHRYHSILPLLKGKVVLDIACGEGYGTALMAKEAKSVLGVDISSECITNAKQKYTAQNTNIRFIEGDIENIPVKDQSIDVVVSFETIEHVSAEGQQTFLKEVKRVLTKGGCLLISTPDKENYSEKYNHENQFHVHELTRNEFVTLLSEHFKNTQMLEQGFEIVSVITPADHSGIESVRLIDWQPKVREKKRKYLVAIASDTTVDWNNISSIVIETDKDYIKQVDRIIELQNEVEERTAWALKLDQQRVQNEASIQILKEQAHSFHKNDFDVLQAKIEALQSWLIEQNNQKEQHVYSLTTELNNYKQQSIAQLKKIEEVTKQNESLSAQLHQQKLINTNNDRLIKFLKEHQQQLESKANRLQQQELYLTNELKEKDNLLQDLQFNLTLTRQQLGEVNNRLVTIYDSDGWRALEKYYNVKGKYLNENSQHYKLLRQAFNFLRNRKLPVEAATQKLRDGGNEIIKETVQEKDIEISKRTIPFYQQPLVSIVIPVYNAWEMNVQCIDAIIKNTSDVAYEVIIADDCSTDKTKDISNYFENVVHVRNESNLGFLLNCNHAATFAKGQYIHFLNNDTEVKQGWLSSLVRILEKDGRVGMAGSKLIYPDGKLQEAGGIIWKDASGWNYGHKQDPMSPEFNYVKEVDYISGASILIKKDIWQQIGGFDARYAPAYFEDTDLAFEVRKRGFKVIYQPLSVVVHYEGYSNGTDKGSGIKKYQEINAKKFYDKWETVLKDEHFENAQNVFQARDKSYHKKTILVIDHYVPHFDKDAGSRHTYQYLALMIKMGYSVKFIGDNFYKHEPYTTVLQQMGVEVLYGEYYRLNWQKWLLQNQSYIDIIYLHRPHIAIKYIDFIAANTKCKIIYFGHDLHYYREEKQYIIERNPELLKSANEWKRKELQLFEKSDLIITPSEKEKEIISQLSTSFRVSTIPLFYYKKVEMHIEDFSNRKHIMFVGGFNHLPNKDAVLWFIKEIWPTVKESISDIHLIIAGSNVPAEIANLKDSDIIIKGYVTDTELEVLYKQVRAIVIPLRYGAGVKGKLLEAMYNGIPIITTSEGVEGMPGNISFLKATDDSKTFADRLVELYTNEEALIQCSKANINYINTHFTKAIAEAVISDLFSKNY